MPATTLHTHQMNVYNTAASESSQTPNDPTTTQRRKGQDRCTSLKPGLVHPLSFDPCTLCLYREPSAHFTECPSCWGRFQGLLPLILRRSLHPPPIRSSLLSPLQCLPHPQFRAASLPLPSSRSPSPFSGQLPSSLALFWWPL